MHRSGRRPDFGIGNQTEVGAFSSFRNAKDVSYAYYTSNQLRQVKEEFGSADGTDDGNEGEVCRCAQEKEKTY